MPPARDAVDVLGPVVPDHAASEVRAHVPGRPGAAHPGRAVDLGAELAAVGGLGRLALSGHLHLGYCLVKAVFLDVDNAICARFVPGVG